MKDDKFRYLIPHFEEVRGSVEPWLMPRWKARVQLRKLYMGFPTNRKFNFLFVVIELFSIALTVDALQGKTCQNLVLSGRGGSV